MMIGRRRQLPEEPDRVMRAARQHMEAADRAGYAGDMDAFDQEHDAAMSLLAQAGITFDEFLAWVSSSPALVPAAVPPQPSPAMRTLAIPAGYDDVSDRGALLGEVAARYGDHGWQVQEIGQPGADGIRDVVIVAGPPDPTPGRKLAAIPPTTKPTQAPEVEAGLRQHGYELVSIDWVGRQLMAARLTPTVIALRARVADRLRVAPWEIDVADSWSPDEATGLGRLDRIRITRAPLSGDIARQKAFWTSEVLPAIPGTTSGWRVEIDPATDTVELIYGIASALPQAAPYSWSVIDDGAWGDMFFGEDGFGRALGADLSSNPHVLVVGKTGSGKSIFLETFIYNALVHGWEIAIVDPTKRGLDFRWAKPYVRDGGWGCQTYSDALAVLRSVYEEGKRRLDILDSLDVPKWTELSEEDRTNHDIKPILLVLDEGTSFAKLEPVMRSLSPDDPERIEAEELNADKQRSMSLVQKVARELRYVGVHMIFGTQRFSVQDIGEGAGGLRENLGVRILLGRASNTAIGMAFMDPADAQTAYEEAHGVAAAKSEADVDKAPEKRPGRGIAEIDGMATTAFQGWFATHEDLASQLRSRGVEKRAQGDGRPEAPKSVKPFSIIEPDEPEVIVDLGTMAFSLDELEADEPSDMTGPTAAEEETPTTSDDFEVVESADVPTPFDFDDED